MKLQLVDDEDKLHCKHKQEAWRSLYVPVKIRHPDFILINSVSLPGTLSTDAAAVTEAFKCDAKNCFTGKEEDPPHY